MSKISELVRTKFCRVSKIEIHALSREYEKRWEASSRVKINRTRIPLFPRFETLEMTYKRLHTRLERASIREVFENWGSRIEFRGTVNLVLSGTIGVLAFKEKIGCVCENFHWCHGKLRRGFQRDQAYQGIC